MRSLITACIAQNSGHMRYWHLWTLNLQSLFVSWYPSKEFNPVLLCNIVYYKIKCDFGNWTLCDIARFFFNEELSQQLQIFKACQQRMILYYRYKKIVSIHTNFKCLDRNVQWVLFILAGYIIVVAFLTIYHTISFSMTLWEKDLENLREIKDMLNTSTFSFSFNIFYRLKHKRLVLLITKRQYCRLVQKGRCCRRQIYLCGLSHEFVS